MIESNALLNSILLLSSATKATASTSLQQPCRPSLRQSSTAAGTLWNFFSATFSQSFLPNPFSQKYRKSTRRKLTIYEHLEGCIAHTSCWDKHRDWDCTCTSCTALLETSAWLLQYEDQRLLYDYVYFSYLTTPLISTGQKDIESLATTITEPPVTLLLPINQLYIVRLAFRTEHQKFHHNHAWIRWLHFIVSRLGIAYFNAILKLRIGLFNTI